MHSQLTPKEKQDLITLNLEHLINSTIRLVDRLRRSSDEAIAENARTIWIDWKANKSLILKLAKKGLE